MEKKRNKFLGITPSISLASQLEKVVSHKPQTKLQSLWKFRKLILLPKLKALHPYK